MLNKTPPDQLPLSRSEVDSSNAPGEATPDGSLDEEGWYQFGHEVRTYIDERLGFDSSQTVSAYIDQRLGQERAVGIAEMRQYLADIVQQEIAKFRTDELSNLAGALREQTRIIAAPRTIVTDASGKPIGTKIGE